MSAKFPRGEGMTIWPTVYTCLCPKESIAGFEVSLMKTPMEHYLDDLCPV